MSGGAAVSDRRPDLRSLGRVRPRIDRLAREHPWSLVVFGATLLWSALLFGVARDRYSELRYARLDLGNMAQAVWSTAHGRFLESTDNDTGEQITRLASHVDPILAVLTPLWILFPTPLVLEAVQIVAVSLGALPVYWLAHRHLQSESTAAILALAYLAYPWLAWTAVDAIHPVTLAVPLLLLAVWFLDSERLIAFGVCAVLILATGELMGITIAALGIWFAVAYRRRFAGVVIAVGGITWTVIALSVVVPHFSGAQSVFYGAFENVGGSPSGLVRTAVTDPGTVLSAVSEPRDIVYLVLLASPLAATFLLSPILAGAAVPALLTNLLADDPGTTDPHEHYIAAIAPILFAAAAIGLGRLAPRNRLRGATVVLTASVAASIAVGPWPGTLLGAGTWDPLPSSAAQIRALKRAANLVPSDAPVSSTNRVGSLLAARRYAYSAPDVGRAEWVVLERRDTWIPRSYSGESDPRALRELERRLGASTAWRKVFDEGDVVVFKKVMP
jgi:uncharacterized membrane protein